MGNIARFVDQEIDVRPYKFNSSSISEVLCTIVLKTDFLLKTRTTLKPHNTDQMAKDFLFKFSGQAFTVGQLVAFPFQDKKMLGLVVKDLEVSDITAIEANQTPRPKKTRIG